jgi:hypothetical protein
MMPHPKIFLTGKKINEIILSIIIYIFSRNFIAPLNEENKTLLFLAAAATISSAIAEEDHKPYWGLSLRLLAIFTLILMTIPTTRQNNGLSLAC